MGIIQNFKVLYKKSLIARTIRFNDRNVNSTVNVFDALQMIEDAWSNVIIETIINSFAHSFTSATKKDGDLPDHEIYINNIILNEALSISTIFKNETEVMEYMTEENEIKYREDGECLIKQEILGKSVIEEVNIQIDQALDAIKRISTFYFCIDTSQELYKHALQIENDLRKKIHREKNIID